MLIRPARPDEREALVALQWRASMTNPEDRASLSAHPEVVDLDAAEIAAGQVFVAELDGAVVGYANVLPRDDGDVELDGLFVEPELFRRGAGRALVAHCAALARDEGAKALHVVGNEHAGLFYEACGFRFVAPIPTRFGPAMLLRLEL